jgi:hypothetical protein
VGRLGQSLLGRRLGGSFGGREMGLEMKIDRFGGLSRFVGLQIGLVTLFHLPFVTSCHMLACGR